MARADLLVRLAKAGTSGDWAGARSVGAAPIADERAKSHHILVGPPGNGKMSLAEALSVPLLVVRPETMIGSYSGETAWRLRSLMDFVQAIRTLLFFNEFDTIGKERGDDRETGEIKWLSRRTFCRWAC